MRRLLLIAVIALTMTSCEYFMAPGIEVEPKLYMVAVGIGYEHSRINDLAYTKADLNALVAQLESLLSGKMDYEILALSDEEEGFTLERHTAQGIEEIKKYNPDKLMTKEEFKEIFTEGFTSKPEKNDILILYYAGHGYDKTGSFVYTYRYETNVYGTLSSRDLHDEIISLFKCRKLLLLDSCYSGNFIEEGDLAPTIFYSEDGDVFLSEFNLFSSLGDSFSSLSSSNNARPDVFVISAAGRDQLSYENVGGVRHGLFTHALLEYLDYDTDMEEARFTSKFDGKSVSVADLYRGIVDNFPIRDYKRKSTPNTTASKYDMVVFDFR